MQTRVGNLVTRVTCPHCWTVFPPQDICWLTAHQELVDDPRLGPNAQQRFVPSRFTPEGLAIDSLGMTCQELACPSCHLRLPRAVLNQKPFFISIAGAPSCGKSFLLAAMAWKMRNEFPRVFQLDFVDADPEANRILGDYEEQLFVNSSPDQPVKLAKTQEAGDWYNHVTYEEQTVVYPQPFLFEVRPGAKHPSAADSMSAARLICMYDNAGESFQPGKDTVTNAVTRHLASANAWFFCYDPTQDPRFREACKGISGDPQIVSATVTSRQETLFHEMLTRIRKHGAGFSTENNNRPLIVLCTKFDAWQALYGSDLPGPPIRKSNTRNIGILDLKVLRAVSDRLEQIMGRFSPELVSAAKSFSSRAWFLPISATGTAAVDIGNGATGFLPKDLKPVWCEYPVLLALGESTGGLVPVTR